MASATRAIPEYWFIFHDDFLLMPKNEKSALTPLDHSLLEKLRPFFLRQHFLGNFDNSDCFCAEVDTKNNLMELLKSAQSAPRNIEFIPLRQALHLTGEKWFKPITKARSILNWDKNNQYKKN